MVKSDRGGAGTRVLRGRAWHFGARERCRVRHPLNLDLLQSCEGEDVAMVHMQATGLVRLAR